MKTIYKNNLIKISLLLMFISGSSCESWLDINVSPNVPITPPINTILASATADVGFMMGSDIHRYSAIFAQQFTGAGAAGIQTVDFSRYILTETDVNNLWRTRLYAGGLADMERVIASAGSESPRYAGIAKTLQAFSFMIAVDSWGDVPFTEALQYAANLRPRYDKSADIYPGIVSLIDEAQQDLARSGGLAPGNDDFIYAGDTDKWIRLGNALKLRLFLHYYPTNPQAANQGITALLNQPLLRSNADNFQMSYVPNDPDRANPIDQFERRRQNQFIPSSTIVSLMNATSDPRRAFYFTGGTTFSGRTPGVAGDNITTSRMHSFIRGAVTNPDNLILGYAGDAPIRILTFAEQNFILAEHFSRQGNLPQANTFYREGIRASMMNAGVATTAINAYLNARESLEGIADAEVRLQRIIEEKYVANFGVAVEPWTDWRRTGYPVLGLASDATLTAIPRVLPYSDLERVTNPENTPVREDISKPGNSKPFWDPQ
ncbi:MAG: SusD/RagB family nutrient-binding outer membrane lipoprotein [Cyclobacteriaceae bacterium]|nr:SusD/RagB family nutrient-binding outer membrane lipoprotein [Cyclobacteriaceae bacterium]